MAKRFFYVCAGLLCLALTYHLGAGSASAQLSGGQLVVGIAQLGGSALAVVTGDGDVYMNTCGTCSDWTLRGNVFGSGPTPTGLQESFGSLKARYRGEREPQAVKPSTNR